MTPLFVVLWQLVVLDEAARISNSQSQSAQAIYNLQAIHKLALTGTPLQNDYTDLQGLMKFLGIEPWKSPDIFEKVLTKHC